LCDAANFYDDLAMTAKQLQSSFFAQLADPQALRLMFEHLPEVYFFVKDRDSRLIAASSNILSRLGMKHEHEFVGKLDSEVFPPHVAAEYREDDLRVFRSGKPLIHRLELWYDPTRTLDWCLTTKVPLFGAKGKVIGLMGITKRDADRSALQPHSDVERAKAYLRANTGRVITTAELAAKIGVSKRSLNRKVNEALGISPYELTLRLRVQAAAEALVKDTASIAEVALAHGFCDQSTFTQHFRKRMGTTPRQFRLRHCG
jgi:AraC-like DNA-binding protein